MARFQIALLALVLGSLASIAQALEIKSYSDADFKAAQAASKSIVVWFHASWCPTCRRQEQSLSELSKDKSFDSILVLQADYDDSEDLQKRLKVTRQSSMVAFKGAAEVGRSIGVTREPDLAEFLKKTL